MPLGRLGCHVLGHFFLGYLLHSAELATLGVPRAHVIARMILLNLAVWPVVHLQSVAPRRIIRPARAIALAERPAASQFGHLAHTEGLSDRHHVRPRQDRASHGGLGLRNT